MRWLTALVITGVLALGSVANAQGGLGKKEKGSGEERSSGSGQKKDSGGSRDSGGRPDRTPPSRDNGNSGGGRPDRTPPPARDNGGQNNQSSGFGKKDNNNGGGASQGRSDYQGGGRPSRPPVRESPPQRDNGGRDNQSGGLGKKDNNNGGGAGQGRSDNQGDGRPSRPPVRESPPQRDNGGRDNQSGGLGKKDNNNGGGASQGRRDNVGGGNQDRQTGGNPGLGRRDDRGNGNGTIRGGIGQSDGRNSDGNRQDLRGQDLLGKRPQPRSGQPSYNGNNNLASQGRVRDTKPVEIGRLPIDLRKGNLDSQVRREGTPERVYNNGRGNNNNNWNNYNWRNGYCQYDLRWRDNNFCYPYYTFSYSDRCAISPWYYYSNLPGYIVSTRVRFGNFGLDIRWGDNYDWNRYDRYDRYSNNYELGRAIEDIRQAFDRGSYRALGYLIPSNSTVYVRLEDGYGYNMDGDDFYDLLVDNITSTQTTRYTITGSRWGSRGEASVTAAHEFTDSWGRRQCVYHRYTLVEDRRGFRIAEFQINPDRFSW